MMLCGWKCQIWIQPFVLKETSNEAVNVVSRSNAGYISYHVIVIEETQGSHAVVISIDPHHSLGGCCQGVLKVALPSLVFIHIGVFLEAHPIILQKAHRSETELKHKGQMLISKIFQGTFLSAYLFFFTVA